MASWHINPASLKICQRLDGSPWKLGEGAYGSVFRAMQNEVREVAIKVSTVNLSTDPLQNRFWREIEFLAGCRDR